MAATGAPQPVTRILAGGEAAHWQGVVDRCRAGEATTLKVDGGTSVLLLPGKNGSPDLIVKRWELRGFGPRVKSLLGMSRARRHWRGAAALTKAGVRTATCHTIWESTEQGGTVVEWLVMERLPGKTLLQHMADGTLSAKQEHDLARAVGKLIGSMGTLYNRDGKPSNLIVAHSADGSPTIAVIDCVAVRRLKLPMLDADDAAIDMIANLLIEPIGCGVAPRRSLRLRSLKAIYSGGIKAYHEIGTPPSDHRTAWRTFRNSVWLEVADHIAIHGDPTPKVNPLTPPSSLPAG